MMANQVKDLKKEREQKVSGAKGVKQGPLATREARFKLSNKVLTE